MFQCGASVAEGCSALKQYWVFDMKSRTFEMLHFNIELTVVIASNTKRRRNVVLMFGQRQRQWYIIKPTKKSESRNPKFQSISHDKNNPTIIKMAAKKTHKTHSKKLYYLKSHNSPLVEISLWYF